MGGMNVDKLYISHAQVNRAPPGRRRTYRAHGRIGKYASQPAHVELVLSERSEGVRRKMTKTVRVPVEERSPRRRRRRSDSSKLEVAPPKCSRKSLVNDCISSVLVGLTFRRSSQDSPTASVAVILHLEK